ncbi:MAG: chromosome segregation protein SMC, partial [Clostridia bacterium]
KSSRVRENGIEKHNGFVGIASDLVSFDEKYAGIFGSVLGRVVVTENIDCATSLARAFGYRFRIVTLDGQVINAGGSFTGGSTSKSAGILTRANEINRLKDEIAKSHTRRQQLDSDKCEAASELSKFMFDIEVYENDKRRAEDVRLRVSTELSHFAAAESDMDGERAALDAENEKLSERRCARIHDVAAMAERIAELEAEVREVSDKIELALLENEELSKARGTLSGELALLREEAAGAAAERVSLIQSRSELMALHDAIKGGSEQKRRLITEYRERNEAIAGEIVTMGEQVAEFNAGLSSVAAEISSIAEEKMKLEALRNKKDKESKSKNDEILNLERERARIASKKDAAESEERQITDKLWETYELTVSAARELRRELTNRSEAGARIAKLKNERKLLGNVNVGAIEEYERVSERYGFLSAQRDDLEKSAAELTDMIAGITARMRDIFGAQFKVINENFGETFTEIFGGGTAELSLDDPSDILNCGIEIRVQPPGKTLRTITLLSGGERAFVAIALYFAIMKVRPTPFCVLDEIEAALDDVNVVRYANYLRKLASTTQFIVITHRRGTMEEADVLYGVTMQDQGISKMLTISIAQVEEELHIKLK